MKNKCLGLLALLLLAGCSKEEMVAKFTPAQEDLEARAYIHQLQERKLENIEARLDQSIQSPDVHKTLEKMSALLPAGQPKSIKTIGAQTLENNNIKQVNLTYELEYPGQWLLVNVATRAKGGKAAIIGLNVVPQPDSMENLNRFSLSQKPARHYIILALAIAAALFSLVTLVACIRIKPLKRRWLWIVGILFGVGQLGLNWTSGAVFFNLLHFQLFSAGAFAPPFGPWMLSVSLPVFAILFWMKRKTLLRQAVTTIDDDPVEKPVAV